MKILIDGMSPARNGAPSAMLSPEFDYPQTPETVTGWFHNPGLERIEVLKAGQLVWREAVRHASRH